MSSYPPPSGPPLPTDWKLQRRLNRDQAKAQQAFYRAQARAQRRSSIVGPLLVIAVGVVFFLMQTGHLSSSRLWDWYARWWPLLLVAIGVLLLAEWLVDQALARRSSQSGSVTAGAAYLPVRRSIGTGVIFLLVLLIGTGAVLSAVGHDHRHSFLPQNFGLDGDDFQEFLGDKHESDQAITHPLPPNATVTLTNPHGDITVSGTSDDGQLHITEHRQVYSRSDSDANTRATQLSPNVETSGSSVNVTVPSLDGAHADLNVLLPSTVGLSVNANHGDIRVQSVAAPLTVTANHGDTDVSAITGPINAHVNSGSGSFSAHGIHGTLSIEGHGHDLTLSDIAGGVTINGDFFGTTHLEQIHGAVKFHTSRTDLQLGSLAGDLDITPNADLSVHQATGPVSLNTRNRNITLESISGDLSVTNHNGAVSVLGTSPLGNMTVENRNGSVELTLPSNAGFAIQADTSNGDLENDFSLPSSGTENHPSLRGTVGGGGPVIRLTTTQGDISLKRASFTSSSPARPGRPTPPQSTSSLTSPDGSSLVINKEGTIATSPDGDRLVIGKDGVRATSNADGSTLVIGKNGLRISKHSDGTTLCTATDGTQLTENSDGTKIFVGRDGTRYVENADGTRVLAAPSGLHIAINADGTISATATGGHALSDAEARSTISKAHDLVRRTESQRDAQQSQQLSHEKTATN